MAYYKPGSKQAKKQAITAMATGVKTHSVGGSRSAPKAPSAKPKVTPRNTATPTKSSAPTKSSRPARVTRAKAIAAQAKKETDPAKKQALLVQRAKLLGKVGPKAVKTAKAIKAKGDAASAEEKAKLAKIKERRQAAKGKSKTKTKRIA